MPWNPNEPLTSWNCPPCPVCDEGAEEATCQCFMMPNAEDDHKRIVELGRDLLSESCDRRLYQDLHVRWRNTALQAESRVGQVMEELAAAREREAALAELLEWVVGDHNAPSDCFSTGPITGTPKDDLCPACAAVRYLKSNKLSTPILATLRREAKREALEKGRAAIVGCVCNERGYLACVPCQLRASWDDALAALDAEEATNG